MPIDGRAARMTRLPGWKPDVRRSRSRNPLGIPVSVGARLVQLRDPLETLEQQVLDVREIAGHTLLREGEHELLRAIDEILLSLRSAPGRAV